MDYIRPSADEEDQESDIPYGYVANNPIVRTDPDGEIWNFVIGAAIGAGTEYVEQVVSLDDLDEATDSLENRFFAHPNDSEMKRISDELSALFKK